MNTNYLVVTTKQWHIASFKQIIAKFSGNWTLISEKKALTKKIIQQIKPKYIFFTHWSWIVAEDIVNNYNCICFHPTDLPFGKGGSPLQNLIISGHKKTKITAFRMNNDIDSGDVYLKRDLDLTGSAYEIFQRMAIIYAEMIHVIISKNPIPSPQRGKGTIFKRRTPTQSQLPKDTTIEHLYNHIRMLDAPSYPKAFVDIGHFHLEFEQAKLKKNQLTAKVIVKLNRK